MYINNSNMYNKTFDKNKYGTFNKLAKTGTSKYKKEQMLKVT